MKRDFFRAVLFFAKILNREQMLLLYKNKQIMNLFVYVIELWYLSNRFVQKNTKTACEMYLKTFNRR